MSGDGVVLELSQVAEAREDSIHLKTAVELMQRNGWVFVEIPPHLKSLSIESAPTLIQYFTSTTHDEKIKHTEFMGESSSLEGAVYGYNKQKDFKEGLRLLTGGRLKPQWVPQQVQGYVQNYVQQLDEMMLQLLKVLEKTLFRKSEEELSRLPFLKGSPKATSNFTEDNFAMLDIVYYQNHNPNSKTTISVAEHYDPGLLSLNVLSTQPGLQFKTTSGQWIDVPQNVGVLWAGELASLITNNNIKPAIHRVISPDPFLPRLSIWIEICTEIQDIAMSAPAMQQLTGDEQQNMEPSLSLASGYDKFGIEPQGAPMTSITIYPGETLERALRRASETFGIPMTKLITYYCPICVRTVMDLLSHFQEEHKSTPLVHSKKETCLIM